MSTYRLINADVIAGLRQLPDESAHCCVTSPPYWGLRDYGIAGQMGLEESPEAYVAHLVDVFREVRRVLLGDGTSWLNLGDSYATGGGAVGRSPGGGTQGERFLRQGMINTQPNRMPLAGFKSKDLIGIPWRVAFALQADGWYLRSDIIWHKPNPMPESVTDRPTKSHEYLFLLAKSQRYYYDRESIYEPFVSDHGSGNGFARGPRLSFQNADGSARGNAEPWNPPSYNGSSFTKGKTAGPRANVGQGQRREASGRNKRSVWTISTQSFPEAHFATFPEALVEPCILAGSPRGGMVLDPFSGSGTTGVVAVRHGRDYVGIELNPEYVAMSRRRICAEAPMFTSELCAEATA